MPEGDTVFRAARSLHRALAGRVLTRTDFRVPRLANADLSGQAVLEVVSRGKHMLLRTDQGMTLHTHFLMQGEWVLYRRGDRWSGGPGHEIRLVLETDEWIAVGYRMPVIDLVETRQEERLVGHLGPDLLDAEVDLDEAVRRLRLQPGRAIGEALLDQAALAGIGNVYKNEVLFLKGLHPWTPVVEVPDLEGLVALAHRLLRANRENASRTTTGSTRRDEKAWVFERAGKPCRRCRERIQVGRQGCDPAQARLTYWCPRCQPERR